MLTNYLHKMTAIITESMLNHLENNGLIPDKQKDNCRKSRCTKINS